MFWLFGFLGWASLFELRFHRLGKTWEYRFRHYSFHIVTRFHTSLAMLSSWIRLAMPFALLQLLSVVSAQIPTPTSTLTSPVISTPTPTPSTEPTVHLVKVGAGGFKFEPASLEGVVVGDVVTFEFYPLDHSVARADFNSPCMPYEYAGRNRTGFFSDVQWVNTVNDVSICFISP